MFDSQEYSLWQTINPQFIISLEKYTYNNWPYLKINMAKKDTDISFKRFISINDISNSIINLVKNDLDRSLAKKYPVIFCGQNPTVFYQGITCKSFIHLPLSLSVSNSVGFSFSPLYDIIIVASQNSFQHLPLSLQTKEWIAVGPETQKKMEESLKRVVSIPTVYSAMGVANSICSRYSPEYLAKLKVLWVGAGNGIKLGIDHLQKVGVTVEVFAPYHNTPLSINQFQEYILKNKIDDSCLKKESIWIFTSPSSVKAYLELSLYHPQHIIACIGNTTASIFLEKQLVPYYIAEKSQLSQIKKDLLE